MQSSHLRKLEQQKNRKYSAMENFLFFVWISCRFITVCMISKTQNMIVEQKSVTCCKNLFQSVQQLYTTVYGFFWLIKTPRLSGGQSKLQRRDNEKRILLAYNFVCGLQTASKLNKEDFFMSFDNDLHSLSHTKWNCKYHVVFAPKYRRKAFYEARRIEVGQILR